MAQQRVEFFDDRDDAALLAAARGGDTHSADVLWVRVRPAVVSVARRIARSEHDAEDLASEALSKVFAAINDGHGPSESLLPYVCQTMRNLHVSTMRREARAGSPVELDDEHDLDLVTVEPDALESEIVTNAFKNLPARWRHVLWASLVEGRDGGEIADQLGIRPAAVHALKARALEGLRQRYLTEHAKPGDSQECSDVHREFAALARGKVRRSTDVTAVWRHLRSCEHCAEGYREISAMNNRIGALLGPAASASVLGALQHQGLLGSLGTLRASTSLAKLGTAAGFTGVIAASVVAAVLTRPTEQHVAPEALRSGEHGQVPAGVAPPAGRGADNHHEVPEATPQTRATPTPATQEPCLAPGQDPLSEVASGELVPGVVASIVPAALPTALTGGLEQVCTLTGAPSGQVLASHGGSGSSLLEAPLSAVREAAPSVLPAVPQVTLPSVPVIGPVSLPTTPVLDQLTR